MRLNRGFGSALVVLPLSTQELPMAINVTPTSEGAGDTAQTASLSHSRLWPPEGPCFPPPRFPAGNGAAAGGLCAGLGGRSLPGGWRLPPARCQALQCQRGGGSAGAAALIPAPSVPRRAGPASEPPAGAGTYMLSRKVTAAWHRGSRRKRCKSRTLSRSA